MALVGAGASFGCDDALDCLGCRPPLGDQLYSRLSAVSETWRRQPRQLFSGGFEAGMKAVLDAGDGRQVWPLWREAALYFWTIRAGYGSTYTRLLRQLRANDRISLSLATLNYDLLLEQSLEEVGIDYHYGGIHRAPPHSLPLFKLHGSINWVSSMTVRVGQASAVQFTGGDLEVVYNRNDFESSLERNELGAILSIYEPGKRALNEPRYIDGVQAHWRDSLAHLDALVCIGVRPVPHDQHIWEPIRCCEAIVIVVDPDTSQQARWREVCDFELVRFIAEGFADALAPLGEALASIR